MGIVANKMMGIVIHDRPSSMIIRPAQKATIIVAIEMKRVERAMINLLGKDLRKSSIA